MKWTCKDLALRSQWVGLCLLVLGGCAHGPQLQYPPPAPARATRLVDAAQRQLYQQGDPEAALRTARQAMALDPALAAAHRVAYQVLTLRGDLRAAHEHVLAALADARDTNTARHMDRLALSYMTRPERQQLAHLLDQLSRHHPSAHSRSEALAYLPQVELLLGRGQAARDASARLPLLRHWHGIGGFDNEEGKGFDTPYPPEREIQLERAYHGSQEKVRWRPVQLKGPLPYIELDELFYPFRNDVAYLVTFIESPKTQDAFLELTTSVPVKVWLNERQLFANRHVRRYRQRQFRIPVHLLKGGNKLLIKSCQDRGPWRLGSWLSATDGSLLALRSSAKPLPYTRDPGPPRPFSTTDVVLGPKPPELTAALTSAEAFASAGLYDRAMDTLAEHLQQHQRDPVALLLAARLHMREKQLQRASQLVERGRALGDRNSAAFWIQTAGLYRRRGQHDRAFAALERAEALSRHATLPVARARDKLYRNKGWQVDRLRQAQKLHASYPRWDWPTDVLASASLALGRTGDALRWLRATLQLSPAGESTRNSLVRLLTRQGRCGEAIAEQRKTTTLRPYRADPFLRLGRTLWRCGRPDAALKALQQASARIPSWSKPYVMAGKLLLEQGRPDEALAQWDRGLHHAPEDVRLWDRVNHLRPDVDPVLRENTPDEAMIARVLASGAKLRPVQGASVLWLLDHEVTRVMADGTVKRVVTTIRRAVDRAGRDALGQARLPGSGLVKVLQAYTVDPKGRRREVTSMHGRKVRYPTLHEGATVVLQYRQIRRPSGYLRQHFASKWFFQHKLEQSMLGRWVLAVPKARKLSINIQGEVQHEQSTQGELAVHTFTAAGVPPLRLERQSLPAADLLRRVAVSTIPSWDYFSEWGRSLTSEVFAMDPDLRATLARLVKGKKTVAEKIDAVYRFALTEIRYQQDYETFIAGVKPHRASAVLARGYGDCKDKSVLMIAMLRHLGLPAHLALVRTFAQGRVLPDVPSQQFNHAVAYLPRAPGYPKGRFLDATAENLDLDTLRPDIQGTLALVLFPEGYRLVPIPYQSPAHNWVKMNSALRLDANGTVTARLTVRAKGATAGRMRKPLQNHQVLRQFAQGMVHQIFPSCSLTAVEAQGEQGIDKPLEVQVQASCPGAARLQDGKLHLTLPKLAGSASRIARWSERQHPLYLGPPSQNNTRVAIELPAGASLERLPDALSAKSQCADISTTWERKGDGLRYEQQLQLTCPVIKAADYPPFRDAVNKLAGSLDEELVIQLAAAAGESARSSGKGKGKRPVKGGGKSSK